ncbi:hypothetical protein ACQUW5_02150 [Legionella sp. CNM-1927-20]|uniref:hypothetical protein n=1 Tax=Legionella sp. CNM-1927-20 TaxID=3422221 RepID=UPI00403ADF9C
MKCPACGYIRKENDYAPEWQCPSCKIAYNKFHSSVDLNKVRAKFKTTTENQSFFKKYWLPIILILTNALLIFSWIHFIYKQHNKSTSSSTSYIQTQEKAQLNLDGIDLNKVESHLEAAKSYSLDCKYNAQIYHKKDESCYKIIELLNPIKPDIDKLITRTKNQDLNQFNYTDRTKLNDILKMLENISKDIETVELLIDRN